MSKHSLPSIEKFAAYLDGNLSQDEMKQCEGLAENNETFRQLLGANSLVEETIASYNDVDFEVPEDILNQEFEIPSLDNESDMDDSVLDMKEHLSDFLSDGMKDNETPINLSGSEQNEQNKVMLNIEDINNSMEQTRQTIIEEAQKQYGLEPLNIDFDPNTYQWEQDTCAIRSQEIVLRSFGIDVSQSDLINEATSHGWYTKGQGTNLEDVGNLLDLHNIPNHRVENANVFNLVDELGQGHKVIVGVDVDELYGNSFWQSVKEFLIGKTPNHAMIVSGIDTSDPNNTMVVLTDPGTGKTLFECPYERFLSAWNDSECFMVATDDPAPLEFNSDTMINFDYDKGHVSFLGKMPFEKFHNEVAPNVDDYLDSLDSYIDSLEKFTLSDVKTLDQFEDMMDKADIAHQKAHDLKADNLHEKLSKSFNSSTDDSDDDSREPEDLDPEDDSTHHYEENEESNDDASDIDELDEL